jgi:phospholipid-translocating ATPase
MLGYATLFTSLPVFSIILDKDVNEKHAFEFPTLYKSLLKGRDLSYKTFAIMAFKSIY